MRLFQQGDVLLKTMDQLPNGVRKLAHTRLAEGEATGHAHVACGDGVELFEKDGIFYLSAPDGVRITHEEHTQVSLPAGIFEVQGVQEYDHFAEEARRVVD